MHKKQSPTVKNLYHVLHQEGFLHTEVVLAGDGGLWAESQLGHIDTSSCGYLETFLIRIKLCWNHTI